MHRSGSLSSSAGALGQGSDSIPESGVPGVLSTVVSEKRLGRGSSGSGAKQPKLRIRNVNGPILEYFKRHLTTSETCLVRRNSYQIKEFIFDASRKG